MKSVNINIQVSSKIHHDTPEGSLETDLNVAAMSFGAQELLSHAGLGSNTLPGWLVLIVLFVP